MHSAGGDIVVSSVVRVHARVLCVLYARVLHARVF